VGTVTERMAKAPLQPARTQPVRLAASMPAISTAATMLIILVIVAALSFGREVFIPLALAILLSFALAPLATRLRRLGFGRVPSVIAVVLLVSVLVLGFAALVAHQLVLLADNLPRYEYNLRSKIRSLDDLMPTGGMFERATRMVQDVGKEIEDVAKEREQGAPAQAEPEERAPLPVEVHQPPPGPLRVLGDFLGPLVTPLATAGLVVVFVIFVLLQREDLRDRLIRLFGSGDVHRTTEAMNDAARRISRYLLMQLLINLFYGITVGIGLYLIGVPNPILWGLLATLLRFVPYVGPVVSALAPIALSIAVDRGWTTPLLTIALFLALELFINNVLEPWLYGSSTGISPIAIIVAAVFWTTLWGPVGLLLSTPLTVCLAVLGRHIPQLQFFDVLLGSEPVLEPEVKFYQRILAGDPEEAAEVADDFLEDDTLDALYDEVIMPALVFAEQDRLRGVLDQTRRNAVARDTMLVIEELIAEDVAARQAAGEETVPKGPAVLCIGARRSLDEAAAAMFAHLLQRRGFDAETRPSEALGISNLNQLQRDDLEVICLSCVNPRALQHARRIIQRLRRRFGADVTILLALWNAKPADGEPKDALAVAGADRLATSLPDALRQVESSAGRGPGEAATPDAA
jgi:predicted PurR-regulated permease PerM